MLQYVSIYTPSLWKHGRIQSEPEFTYPRNYLNQYQCTNQSFARISSPITSNFVFNLGNLTKGQNVLPTSCRCYLAHLLFLKQYQQELLFYLESWSSCVLWWHSHLLLSQVVTKIRSWLVYGILKGSIYLKMQLYIIATIDAIIITFSGFHSKASYILLMCYV